MTELRGLVSMPDAIAAVRDAFIRTSRGEVEQPLRSGLRDPKLLQMAINVKGGEGSAVKVVTVRPGNVLRGLPAIQGLVLWFDGPTGTPEFAIDGAAVTTLRTGAATGVATDVLSVGDASVLAMIGAGAQALDQVLAVTCVRRIREVRIASRTSTSSWRLRRALRSILAQNVKIVVAPDADSAIVGADVVCCATTAAMPVFDNSAAGERVHVNAVGAHERTMCEIPAEFLARAEVIAVDQLEAAMAEAGDLLQAIRSGHIAKDQLVELGSILEKGGSGRERGPTVFKSVGIAAQDWAIARVVRSRLAVVPQGG